MRLPVFSCGRHLKSGAAGPKGIWKNTAMMSLYYSYYLLLLKNFRLQGKNKEKNTLTIQMRRA